MGKKKKHKKSDKKSTILLITAIIQLITAITTIIDKLIELIGWKNGEGNLPNNRINFFLLVVNIKKEGERWR